MHEAAGELEFEQAARLRDRLTSVQKAIEKQQMVAERSEDFDVLGIADDELEAAVQVFFVRQGPGGRPQGLHRRQGRGPHPGRAGEQRRRAPLRRPAARASRRPCSCPSTSTTPRSTRSGSASLRGSKVAVRVPQRGEKRELQETVTRNAREEFVRHRLRRATDHNSRARALNELQDHLGLPEAPLRIECYDMSHIQGSDYVGSMVVVEDGLPKKSEYRRFKIKGEQGNDDFAAMEQVLTRRLTAYLAERRRPPIGGARQVLLPAAAAPRRRRQGPAQRGRAGARGARAGRRDPGRVARQAVRGGVRPRRGRPDPAARASPRRSTCCSGSATRPTGSPSRSTASCGASA